MTDLRRLVLDFRTGRITARTLDYFALLVGASIVALCCGVLATLCVKHELRGLAWFFAAAFFASALVAAYCFGKLLGRAAA